MSLIKTIGDLIRKLTEQGIDIDDVGISEDDLWFKGDEFDDDESPDDQD